MQSCYLNLNVRYRHTIFIDCNLLTRKAKFKSFENVEKALKFEGMDGWMEMLP